MKRALIGALIGAVALVGLFSSDAGATPLYGEINAGVVTQAEVESFDLDGDLVYGVAVGTGLGPFRVEAGARQLEVSLAGLISATARNYSAGAYLDLPVSGDSVVYAGAGLDYVTASVLGLDAEGDGHHYAVGYTRRIGDKLMLDLEYRHLSVELDTDFNASFDASADTVTAGLRFAL